MNIPILITNLNYGRKMIYNFVCNLIKDYQFQRNLTNLLDDFSSGCDIEIWAASHPEIISNIVKTHTGCRTIFEIHLI